jgi:hypothetical protein
MAPLPANNTARFFLDYTCAGKGHTAEVRFNGATSPSDFGDTMNAILNTLGSHLYSLTIDAVRFSADGSDISLPVTSGIEGNSYGTTDPVSQTIPFYMRFQGRSAGGRRCSFDLYTTKFSDANFRVTSAESSDVADVVDILNAEPSLFCGIDGLGVTWYPYVNIKASSYWTRKIRNG